jgi:hypothetical protein
MEQMRDGVFHLSFSPWRHWGAIIIDLLSLVFLSGGLTMATIVMLKHPKTGVLKKGFFGFSWTTFFFGGFPALFRGELGLGLIVIIINLCTWGVAGFIWAFFYNKSYTVKLIENGYEFADSDGLVARAQMKLGIVAPAKQLEAVG